VNEEEIRAAKDALSEQTKRYQRADDTRTAARNAAIELALKLLDAKVGPSEVARLSPFTDSYIRKAARKAGLPPVTSPRGATAKRDH
jgi:hypothetical protein